MGKEFNHRGHRGKIYFLKNSVYSLVSITPREFPLRENCRERQKKIRR